MSLEDPRAVMKSDNSTVQTIDVDLAFEVVNAPTEDDISALQEKLTRDWNTVSITEVEISRPAGMGGSQAMVKAYLPETSGLEYAVAPYTDVELKVKLNGEWAFTGTVIRVTENEEGIVTIDAMDARRQLHTHTVRLDLRDNGTPSSAVIEDLLVTDGPFDEDQVIINLPAEQTISAEFGDKRRAPLREVLKYILQREHAFAYVDRKNRIIIQPCPPIQWLTANQIISFDAGDTKDDNTTVIAEAPQADSQLNFFGSHHTAQSVSRGSASKGEENGQTKLVKDNVSKSVKQSTNQAVDAQVRMDFINTIGEVELVGDHRITPFDDLTIENLPDHAEMAEGTYAVQEVIHKISASNGFTTTVKLTTDLGTLWDTITDPQDVANTRKNLLEKMLDTATPIGPGLEAGTDFLIGASILPGFSGDGSDDE